MQAVFLKFGYIKTEALFFQVIINYRRRVKAYNQGHNVRLFGTFT